MTIKTVREGETGRLATLAFWEILASGKPPTVDLVNDWLLTKQYGRRSRNQVSDAVKECWSEVGKKFDISHNFPDLPPETVTLVITLRDQLYQLAKLEFDRILDDERVQHQAAMFAEQNKVAEISIRLAEDEKRCQTMEMRIEKLSSDLTASNDKLLAVQNEIIDEQKIASDLRQEISRREIERTTLLEKIAEMQATHSHAIAVEEARYSDMRKTLMQQVDDEKTRATKLSGQIEKEQKKYADLALEKESREQQAADARAKLSVELGHLQGTIAALKTQLDDAHSAAEVRAQELESKNALLRLQEDQNARLQASLDEFENRSEKMQELVKKAFLEGSKNAGKSAKAIAQAAKEFALATKKEV